MTINFSNLLVGCSAHMICLRGKSNDEKNYNRKLAAGLKRQLDNPGNA